MIRCQPDRPRSSSKAFTLVELLVVVGIIGLLVAILLPAVSRARELANVAVCAANLRAIGTAMQAYILEHRTLPPSKADRGGAIWPEGLFWSNHLVQTKFISAPTGPGSDKTSVFRCPTGSMEDITFSGFGALSPRDPVNRGFIRVNDPSPAHAVTTWYALNSMVAEGTSGGQVGVGNDAPFIWVKSDTDGNNNLVDGRYTRTRTMIKKADRLVMAFDGNTYNWNNISGSTGLSARISGRHGGSLNNDKDGYFNAVFFDGHVSYLSTLPYTLNGMRAEPSVTIWFMKDQK